MFARGQVWAWNGVLYLLLYPLEKEYTTVYHEGQQLWHAFELETGDLETVLMHSDVSKVDQRWDRIT